MTGIDHDLSRRMAESKDVALGAKHLGNKQRPLLQFAERIHLTDKPSIIAGPARDDHLDALFL
ncbi:hypothetical protein [Rhizobium leguminosarum]|uniref:hypothetical protein n=1 Tax=Rhizobium leguminosarum TaxID=384 RepID=UPI00131A3B8A|nr:hypothetical protein [Rhizobium leguminosarum]